MVPCSWFPDRFSQSSGGEPPQFGRDDALQLVFSYFDRFQLGEVAQHGMGGRRAGCCFLAKC